MRTVLVIEDDDAVGLDVMMPDVDGTRVLEQRLEDGGGRLPQPVARLDAHLGRGSRP